MSTTTTTLIEAQLTERARAAARRSGRTREQEFVALLDDPANRIALGVERQIAREMAEVNAALGGLFDADGLAILGEIYAKALAEPAASVEELIAFKVRITASGRDTYGAEATAGRERPHDDLVLALALVCWYGETMRPLLPAPAGATACAKTGWFAVDGYRRSGRRR
jgi:hypothetical protein